MLTCSLINIYSEFDFMKTFKNTNNIPNSGKKPKYLEIFIVPANKPYYMIELKIGNKDMSMGLMRVNFFVRIGQIFQVVLIKFRTNFNTYLAMKGFKNKTVKLIVTEMTEDKKPRNTYTLDLRVLRVNSDISSIGNINKEYTGISDEVGLVCVPLKGFNDLRGDMSYLSQEEKTPFDAVKEICDKHLKSADEKEIVDKNKNTTKARQLAIAPMKVAAAIDYINNNYGIYAGPIHRCYICSDTNKFQMWDLSKKIDDKPVYKIYHLSEGKKDSDIMKETGKDDKAYYTTSNFPFRFAEQKNLAKTGYKTTFITKPTDGLYDDKKVKTNPQKTYEDTPKDGGSLDIDKNFKSEESVSTARVGLDGSDKFARTTNAEDMLDDGNAFTVSLNRNLILKPLFECGIPVEFLPEQETYAEMRGKYLVKSSKITLTRETTAFFNAIADVTLMRQNISAN